MSRVLVCGGREFTNRKLVFATLDTQHATSPIALVIHGGATGADTLASEWCTSRGIPQSRHPAEWSRYGRKAGPMRNAEMVLMAPDFVLAFPGGTGTQDMVRQARKAGIYVIPVSELVMYYRCANRRHNGDDLDGPCRFAPCACSGVRAATPRRPEAAAVDPTERSGVDSWSTPNNERTLTTQPVTARPPGGER